LADGFPDYLAKYREGIEIRRNRSTDGSAAPDLRHIALENWRLWRGVQEVIPLLYHAARRWLPPGLAAGCENILSDRLAEKTPDLAVAEWGSLALAARTRTDELLQGKPDAAPAEAVQAEVGDAPAETPEAREPPERLRAAHAAFDRAMKECPASMLLKSDKVRYTKEMHKWAHENCEGVPADFNTWTRYVREYERLTVGPTSKPRSGRTGRSIVTSDAT